MYTKYKNGCTFIYTHKLGQAPQDLANRQTSGLSQTGVQHVRAKLLAP
jgi:hypothetical protein